MEYVLNCECTSEKVGEEIIIIPQKEGRMDVSKCVYLEGAGVEIWELFQEGLSAKKIEEILIGKYIVEREVLADDIRGVFKTLIEVGVVSEKNGK